jgi:hypothetical protein
MKFPGTSATVLETTGHWSNAGRQQDRKGDDRSAADHRGNRSTDYAGEEKQYDVK